MNVPVHVTILGKEYQVACPEDQQDALRIRDLRAGERRVPESDHQIRQQQQRRSGEQSIPPGGPQTHDETQDTEEDRHVAAEVIPVVGQ